MFRDLTGDNVAINYSPDFFRNHRMKAFAATVEGVE